MHIVHVAPSGGVLVIAIMFEETEDDIDNEFLKSIKFEQAPETKSGEAVALDGEVDLGFFSDILGGDFYRNKGSLTTSPCSEIVEWFVMAKPSTISPSQVAYFKEISPGVSSYRPIQPLDFRNALKSLTVLSKMRVCCLC